MVERGAKQLGYTNASFLSQMAGPNPMRGISEKTARRFEAALGLARGWLDTVHDSPVAAAPVSTIRPVEKKPEHTSVGLTADVIKLVGKLFDEEGVSLSAMRFADVVALAVMDAVEHENEARPEHIRSLVRLVKPQ